MVIPLVPDIIRQRFHRIALEEAGDRSKCVEPSLQMRMAAEAQ